jgi:hypothetical protein
MAIPILLLLQMSYCNLQAAGIKFLQAMESCIKKTNL